MLPVGGWEGGAVIEFLHRTPVFVNTQQCTLDFGHNKENQLGDVIKL